jgi:hypothetical protein
MGNTVNKILYQPPPPSSHRVNSDDRCTITYHRVTTSLGHTIAVAHIDVGAALTIIHSHGNAEDLSGAVEAATQWCSRLNVNCIAYDYSGYGDSEGVPSEASLHADIAGVYCFARVECGIEPEQLILYAFEYSFYFYKLRLLFLLCLLLTFEKNCFINGSGIYMSAPTVTDKGFHWDARPACTWQPRLLRAQKRTIPRFLARARDYAVSWFTHHSPPCFVWCFRCLVRWYRICFCFCLFV